MLIDVVAVAPWWSPFFRLVQDHAHVFEQLPAELHLALVRQYIRGASHRALSYDQLELLVAPWSGGRRSGEGQAAFYRQISQADQQFTYEIEPLYARLDLPVHIVWRTEDTWIPLIGRNDCTS